MQYYMDNGRDSQRWRGSGRMLVRLIIPLTFTICNILLLYENQEYIEINDSANMENKAIIESKTRIFELSNPLESNINVMILSKV